MGYIQDFESKLRTLIEQGEPVDNIVNWVKQEIYQSYKNGMNAKGQPRSYNKKQS